MFRGSVPPALRQLIHEHVSGWDDVTDVYVGCSGNFTIERALSDAPVTLHGNDVTIYSCTIGAYLAQHDWPVSVKEEHQERWGWLDDWLTDSGDTVATLMLATRMLQGLNQPPDHPYYSRLWDEYRRRWDELHAKTRAKVEAVGLSLGSFYAGDVVEWAAETDRDQAFVCFPPFYAGDYEQQFRGLDRVFDWPEPTYQMFDADRLKLLLDRFTEHRHWVYGTNVRLPDLEDNLRGLVQTTNRGMPVWVYASDGPVRMVRPRQKVDTFPLQPLGPGEEIEGPLRLTTLSGPQFSALRSTWMNRTIVPGAPQWAVGVIAGDRLIGAYAWQTTMQGRVTGVGEIWRAKLPRPGVYLLSDFPVGSSDYRRLSTLIVQVALSAEAHRLLERSANRRYRSVVTTAFSDRPQSMKYRSAGMAVLNRHERDEPPGPDDVKDPFQGKRFKLNYGSPFTDLTLAEILEQWLDKHAKHKVAD